jgi:DNA polymerase-3 subunit delta'
LFASVVGQEAAITALLAAAHYPVHAYLFIGPGGVGERSLARGFAAALLCPAGGCGACETCRRVLEGIHPDLIEVERTGASLSVEDAREVVRLGQRRPLESARQVVVVPDMHLARLAAPVLLKSLEEPPASTVFILLSEGLAPDLATVASRCVHISLRPLPFDTVVAWLVARGVDPEASAVIAEASRGSVERAELLALDPGFLNRLQLWGALAGRLDGTGSSCATLAGELLAALDASVEPLRARHVAELEAREAEAEVLGERKVAGRARIEAEQKRAERRWRTDELRAGLAALAATYRKRLERSSGALGDVFEALDAIEGTAAALVRNPNEALLLEALLVRLSIPARR